MLTVIVILAVLFSATFLVVLTQMREVIILRGEVSALAQLITNPPVPRIIGSPVPDRLRTQVLGRRSLATVGELPGMVVVMFLSDTCGSCAQLVDEVGAHLSRGELQTDSVIAVITQSNTSRRSELWGALSAQDLLVIADEGQLSRECDVRATPMLLAVDIPSGVATEYSYGSGASWIAQRTPTRQHESIGAGEGGASKNAGAD